MKILQAFRMMALLFGAGLAAVPAAAQDSPLAGSWGGALETGAITLRLTLVIEGSDDAATATFTSVDQGGARFPASVQVRRDSVVFEAAMIGAAFRAVRAGDDTLRGVWTQGGGALPLVMARGSQAQPVRRPQDPRPPFPYREEQVAYESDPGVRIAGTLTLPAGAGPHPAVLLISGSGPQDRDESIFNHRPFHVLADYLARRGIAVLRVDDRGVGESTGPFATSTSDDFARDVAAGVRWLRARADIGPVGLIGHSEGGLIAPMVAAQSPDVRFLVLLAGPGTQSRALLGRQTELVLAASGVPDSTIRVVRAVQRDLFDAVVAAPDTVGLAVRLREIVSRHRETMTPAQEEAAGIRQDASLPQLMSPWMRWFLRYDPAPVLRRVTVPVLALNGALDLQVPPDENLAGIEQALRAGGNPDVTVEKLAGLNHLFQTARSGAPSEYGRIDETFAPAALQRIADWIVQRFPPRP